MYLLTASYDLFDVWYIADKGFDRAMNELYCAGSFTYFVGTFFFVPDLIPPIHGHTPEELGAWCFIIASTLFIHACFINGAHTGDVFAETSALARSQRDEHAEWVLR